MATFRRFGRVVVDWPRKPQNKAYYPPKGYAFLVFEHEHAVKMVLNSCFQEEDSYFVFLSSPTLRDKAVSSLPASLFDTKTLPTFIFFQAHVRPWRLSDSEYFGDQSFQMNHRLTAYLVGIPRPMTARKSCIVFHFREVQFFLIFR